MSRTPEDIGTPNKIKIKIMTHDKKLTIQEFNITSQTRAYICIMPILLHKYEETQGGTCFVNISASSWSDE